jgi:hypothetical protein
MPRYRLELRWTPKGYEYISQFLERREKALKLAAAGHVTGPNGGPILIDEGLTGPDWTVEGSRDDVEDLARIFRWKGFVRVNVRELFAIDEFANLVTEFNKGLNSPK